MDLAKIIIAGKTRNYTDLNAAEIAIARKLSGGGAPSSVPFATGTDEQILAMIQAAHAGTIDLQTDGGWAVGDTRTINVSAFTANDGKDDVSYSAQNVDIVITSFDDYKSCGCVMQFDFKNALAEKAYMDYYTRNYEETPMYLNTLPALVAALPTWISDNLISFDVDCCVRSSTSTVYTVSNNKLALRSNKEVTGSTNYAGGTQLQYYTTADNRIKKLGNNGAADFWNTRTVYTSYVFITSSGGTTTATRLKAGVAPFGCL